MSRFLAAGLLLVVVAQTTGALSLLKACDEQCAAEQAGAASCLPGCPDCACCGMARVLLRAPLAGEFAIMGGEPIWPEPARTVDAPAPRDIAHVPKTSSRS